MLRGESMVRSFEAKFYVSRCCSWVVIRRGVAHLPLLPTTYIYIPIQCTAAYLTETQYFVPKVLSRIWNWL